jgi:hypothetical protein
METVNFHTLIWLCCIFRFASGPSDIASYAYFRRQMEELQSGLLFDAVWSAADGTERKSFLILVFSNLSDWYDQCGPELPHNLPDTMFVQADQLKHGNRPKVPQQIPLWRVQQGQGVKLKALYKWLERTFLIFRIFCWKIIVFQSSCKTPKKSEIFALIPVFYMECVDRFVSFR